MDMHILMTKIINSVCKTVLKKLVPTYRQHEFSEEPKYPFFFLLVTVMTDRQTKNHFRYSGNEAPVKETSPLLLFFLDTHSFVASMQYGFTWKYLSESGIGWSAPLSHILQAKFLVIPTGNTNDSGTH